MRQVRNPGRVLDGGKGAALRGVPQPHRRRVEHSAWGILRVGEVMNAKAKGSRNELKSKTLLESCGYEVTKSGGSLGDWRPRRCPARSTRHGVGRLPSEEQPLAVTGGNGDVARI